MDEKKKTLVVGALFVAFLGIGAFQFMPKDKGHAIQQPTEAPANKWAAAEEVDADLKNPQVAHHLQVRDPFSVPLGMMARSTEVAPNLPPVPEMRPVAATGPIGPAEIRPLPGTLVVEPQIGGATALARTEEAPAFGYSVSGVVVGAKPAAVFRDGQGSQRLVTVGGSLDGDTQVKAISLTAVSVSYRGKTLELPIGGESLAK
jgi:hypothetical protein